MPAPVSLSLFRVPITRPAHLRPLRLKHLNDVRQPGHQNRVVQTLSIFYKSEIGEWLTQIYQEANVGVCTRENFLYATIS